MDVIEEVAETCDKVNERLRWWRREVVTALQTEGDNVESVGLLAFVVGLVTKMWQGRRQRKFLFRSPIRTVRRRSDDWSPATWD